MRSRHLQIGVVRLGFRRSLRTDAEDFARGNHGRLRGAHYSPGSRTMTIEIIWPVPSRDNKPISQELRAQAVAHFGWMS
jgi:hypothetical protein